MFWAWKYTILTHHRSLSGKGLKNEKYKFSNVLNHAHSKLFLWPLQLGRRPTPRKFGAIERRGVRPFVLR